MRREEWDRRELRHDPAEAVEFEFHGYNEDESKCFSNFTTTHPFELGDKRWPSANHYFQAMKFKGTDPEYQVSRFFPITSPLSPPQLHLPIQEILICGCPIVGGDQSFERPICSIRIWQK